MPVTSIDSVTTTDAAPAVAPHRISANATKDRAVVAFTPNSALAPGGTTPSVGLTPGAVQPGSTVPSAGVLPGQAPPVLAYRVRVGGVDRATGRRLAGRGAIAGAEPCTPTQPCSSYSVASGTQITETLTYSEFAGDADGAETINVWANAGGSWG